MENFEFKSQICTTKEQSEKLLKLGLKKETADMVHQPIGTTPFNVWDKQEIEDDFYPAWSLHRLIELIGFPTFGLGKTISKDYDCIIAAIGHHINEGLFDKDYLEEKQCLET